MLNEIVLGNIIVGSNPFPVILIRVHVSEC